jgi:hypothetical protein
MLTGGACRSCHVQRWKNSVLDREPLRFGGNLSLGQFFDREFHLGCYNIEPRPPASARVMKDASCVTVSVVSFCKLNCKVDYTAWLLLFSKVMLKRTRLWRIRVFFCMMQCGLVSIQVRMTFYPSWLGSTWARLWESLISRRQSHFC